MPAIPSWIIIRRLLPAAACILAVPAPQTSQAASASASTSRSSGVLSPSANACLTVTAEQALLRREIDLLGEKHAKDHAAMRAQQCEAQRGLRPIPARGPAKTGPATLREDELVILAADELADPLLRQTTTQITRSAARVAADGRGRWSDPFVIPVVGITSVLLHTGKLLFWSYDPNDWEDPGAPGDGLAYVWDPATRTGYSITPPENIWCGGQTVLADGRVYVAGGNLRYPDRNALPGTTRFAGTLTNYTFNPLLETWTKQPDMVRGRWYPTTTKMADNRVLITSGWDETGSGTTNAVVEIFTPAAGMDSVGTIAQMTTEHQTADLYPLQFLLSSGRVLEASANTSYLFNPGTTLWSRLPNMLANHRDYPNAIIHTDATIADPKQIVMVAGGHSLSAPQAANEYLDAKNPTVGWTQYPPWQHARHNANTVVLADGSLLTMGGNRQSSYDQPVFATEMYSTRASDTTGKWLEMAPHTIQAAYHSTAILLPDATVLLSQDDMDKSAAGAAQHKAQIYSPPYLFKGKRPTIKKAPATITWGQTFEVATDRATTGAVLIAPGATTHGNDMHQRAIHLPVQPRGSSVLAATLPASATLVPPGYYMLFMIDSNGIPSKAKFVRVA